MGEVDIIKGNPTYARRSSGQADETPEYTFRGIL